MGCSWGIVSGVMKNRLLWFHAAVELDHKRMLFLIYFAFEPDGDSLSDVPLCLVPRAVDGEEGCGGHRLCLHHGSKSSFDLRGRVTKSRPNGLWALLKYGLL